MSARQSKVPWIQLEPKIKLGLAPIRSLWDMWTKWLQEAFVPYENVTVDEQLVKFRGRCPLRQYIPSKPGKYGIKVWVCADSKTSYAYNMQVYTGKNLDGQREVNQRERVVLDMVDGLENTGRNVICDNFLISLSLLHRLKEKKLSMVGTMRKNKRAIPDALV